MTASCHMCGGRVFRQPRPPRLATCAACLGPTGAPAVMLVDDDREVDALCQRVGIRPTYTHLRSIEESMPSTAQALTAWVSRVGTPGLPALLLVDSTGRGKTTAALAAVRAAVEAGTVTGRQVLVTTEHQLLADARPDDQLRGKRLVVIDELGRAQRAPLMDAEGRIVGLSRPTVDARLALLNSLVTRPVSVIFTTNLREDEMESALGGPAVLSRLTDLCGGQLLALGGATRDMRLH